MTSHEQSSCKKRKIYHDPHSSCEQLGQTFEFTVISDVSDENPYFLESITPLFTPDTPNTPENKQQHQLFHVFKFWFTKRSDLLHCRVKFQPLHNEQIDSFNNYQQLSPIFQTGGFIKRLLKSQRSTANTAEFQYGDLHALQRCDDPSSQLLFSRYSTENSEAFAFHFLRKQLTQWFDKRRYSVRSNAASAIHNMVLEESEYICFYHKKLDTWLEAEIIKIYENGSIALWPIGFASMYTMSKQDISSCIKPLTDSPCLPNILTPDKLFVYNISITFCLDIALMPYDFVVETLSFLPVNALMKMLFPNNTTLNAQVQISDQFIFDPHHSGTLLDQFLTFYNRDHNGQCINLKSHHLTNFTSDPLLECKSLSSSFLADFQLQTIQWLVQQEKGGNDVNLNRHLWCQINSKLFYSPFLQRFETALQIQPSIKGGFNCQSKGLGKTRTFVSFLNYQKEQYTATTQTQQNNAKTLIIVPLLQLQNWQKELNVSHSKLNTYVFHGSTKKSNAFSYIFESSCDVVLTSYGVVLSEFKKGENSALHSSSATFHRIVLDDFHTVFNTKTHGMMLNSLQCLAAPIKWLMSSSPINESIVDLFEAFRFLRIAGFCDSKEHYQWQLLEQKQRSCIKYVVSNEYGLSTCVMQSDYGQRMSVQTNRMYNCIIYLGTCLIWRHEQNQSFNGRNSLIPLPTIQQNTTLLEISSSHNQQHLFTEIEHHVVQRLALFAYFFLLDKYPEKCMQILSLLQTISSFSCVNIDELKESMKEDMEWDLRVFYDSNHTLLSNRGEVIERIQILSKHKKIDWSKLLIALDPPFQEIQDDCAVCLLTLNQPVQLQCRHLFCQKCVQRWMAESTSIYENKLRCPTCRALCVHNQIFIPKEIAEQNKHKQTLLPLDSTANGGIEVDSYNNDDNHKKKEDVINNNLMVFETKLLYLINQIKDLHSRNQKSVIFTQFVPTLNAIKQKLNQLQIGFASIESGFSANKKQHNAERFENDAACAVFLTTYKSAKNYAVKLTAASNVFLVDLCLNKVEESQAIDQILRWGQQNSVVYIHRLLLKDSVEHIFSNTLTRLQSQGIHKVKITTHLISECMKLLHQTNS